MAVLALSLLISAMAVHSSGTWCICKDGVSEAALQKTLDYACGAGADCGPIHQKGPCFQPDNVKAHCSYAANSYFQKNGQAQGCCNFSATAFISPTDPSTTGCVYPSSASSATTTTIPVTTTTSNNSVSPYTGTPTGVYGGIGSGVGPAGAGINPDDSDGGYGLLLLNTSFLSSLISFLFSCLMFWWV